MGGLSQDKSPPRLVLSAKLSVNTKCHILSVLIDSGAEQNFNNSEEICFFVFKATRTPLVLGHPWLRQHNPSINWLKGCVTGWGEECHMTCLKSASHAGLLCRATRVLRFVQGTPCLP